MIIISVTEHYMLLILGSSGGWRRWVPSRKTILTFTGVTVICAPLALYEAGFTGAGVAGGSLAAAWQSSIGLVARGSLFATLQSLGAVRRSSFYFPLSLCLLTLILICSTKYKW